MNKKLQVVFLIWMMLTTVFMGYLTYRIEKATAMNGCIYTIVER